MFSMQLTASGSSPRMRGAHPALVGLVSRLGIIPAYAGSTPQLPTLKALGEDHPRVCGEHALSMAAIAALRGSSPRMRGAPVDGLWGAETTRIIPAYAGSTSRGGTSTRASRDHPRVCGEHCPWPSCAWSGRGSSPRMRGAHHESRAIRLAAGIIPAYAGSTRLYAQ